VNLAFLKTSTGKTFVNTASEEMWYGLAEKPSFIVTSPRISAPTKEFRRLVTGNSIPRNICYTYDWSKALSKETFQINEFKSQRKTVHSKQHRYLCSHSYKSSQICTLLIITDPERSLFNDPWFNNYCKFGRVFFVIQRKAGFCLS
jgi:uncharacterized protein involved in tolerance to divalent cations